MNFIEEENRIYLNDESGKLIAEVTFPNETSNIVNINHTFVDDSLRGQGIAGKLLEDTVEKLRRENKKAHATCSYAVKWFEKNQQHADIYVKE